MSLIVSEQEKNFTPVSEGLHQAVCIGLYDVGEQYSEQFGKSSEKVIIQWELLDETLEIDGKEVRRTICNTYTKSFNEKSNLRKTLKSWRGREFTPEELKAFDLRNILGVPCQLQITHSIRNEKVYANIDSVVSYPKAMPKPVPENELFAFDLDDADWQQDLAKLPEWIQNMVKASANYADKNNAMPFDEEVPFA